MGVEDLITLYSFYMCISLGAQTQNRGGGGEFFGTQKKNPKIFGFL